MRQVIGIVALVLVGVGVALGLAVRLAPVDAALWHVDPLDAPVPGARGWLVRPEGGDAAWPTVATAPASLLALFDQVARASPRTTRIAGSVQEGRITYMTRTRFWGFPDFTTVAALPRGEGATLAVLGRLRFGGSDLGVNRARVERWLGAVADALRGREAG